jgi:hypothetical protein
MQHIQSILPERGLMLNLVDYYYDYMLYWAGGFYHGPSFRRNLLEAYGNDGAIDLQTLDWRWSALLCRWTVYSFWKDVVFPSHRVSDGPSYQLFPKRFARRSRHTLISSAKPEANWLTF